MKKQKIWVSKATTELRWYWPSIMTLNWPVSHNIYQMGSTTSIKFHPWKLINNTCHTIDNMLLLVMVTMGMWSPCGLMNPILSYVLINILDDRVNKCTVSNILVELNLFILHQVTLVRSLKWLSVDELLYTWIPRLRTYPHLQVMPEQSWSR